MKNLPGKKFMLLTMVSLLGACGGDESTLGGLESQIIEEHVSAEDIAEMSQAVSSMKYPGCYKIHAGDAYYEMYNEWGKCLSVYPGGPCHTDMLNLVNVWLFKSVSSNYAYAEVKAGSPQPTRVGYITKKGLRYNGKSRKNCTQYMYNPFYK